MAQVRIVGLKDSLIVSNERAKMVNDIWLNDSISNSAKITIDNISTTKGDIKGIFFDKEEKTKSLPNFEIVENRNTFLSKEQRAEMTEYFRRQNWYSERKIVREDILSWYRLNNIRIN